LILLDRIIENRKSNEISGTKVFQLKDTYGFPEDLTELILREKGLEYNKEEFKKRLDDRKGDGRSATAIKFDDWTVLIEDDEQEFVGYDTLQADVKLTRYRKVTSKKEGEQYQLVFNLTPFYAEGGGQVGDKGYLESSNGDVVYILDTKKENNVIIHFTKNLPKKLDANFKASVDAKQRYRTECNHTATHLLHQALREILGTHVEQKGSAVHSKYLRFDFSHFSKVSVDELRDVENFVNARVNGKLQLEENRNVPMEQAINDGAMALFGEKYGDAVRTIRFGQSIELCGGTHVKNTGDIWHFKITAETAVASGIRRIEAITNDAVKDFYFENNRAYFEMRDMLNNVKQPVKALKALKDENLALKKQIEGLLRDKAKNATGELANELTEINGVQFLAKKVDLDAAGIKDVAFNLGSKHKNLFLLFANVIGEKAMLTCYISKELVAERDLNAGHVVRELGKLIHGGGGGQAFFATAGGRYPDGIPEALQKAKTYIE